MLEPLLCWWTDHIYAPLDSKVYFFKILAMWKSRVKFSKEEPKTRHHRVVWLPILPLSTLVFGFPVCFVPCIFFLNFLGNHKCIYKDIWYIFSSISRYFVDYPQNIFPDKFFGLRFNYQIQTPLEQVSKQMYLFLTHECTHAHVSEDFWSCLLWGWKYL